MRTFALLAPALALVPLSFTAAETNRNAYIALLTRLQRLRGRLYLEDGAIESWQLTADGRHIVPNDERSWHLLAIEKEEVMGCARLQVYPPSVNFADLTVAQSAQAHCPVWGLALRRSVAAKLYTAQAENLRFLEPGGWALTPELRGTTEALRIALGSYALGELLGGCLGLSTATVRHRSASMLRRLGGRPLEWEGQILPPYYDPGYRCEMEVVSFDSRAPHPRYKIWIEQMATELLQTVIFCQADEPTLLSESLLSLANGIQLRAGPASVDALIQASTEQQLSGMA
jgi:hypothetical protein